MVAVIEEKAIRGLREVVLLIFSTITLFLVISLVTFSLEDAAWTHSGSGGSTQNASGTIGAWVADLSLSIFGCMAYIFPLMIMWCGYLIYTQQKHSGSLLIIGLRSCGFIATIITGAALLYMHVLSFSLDLPNTAGGFLGQEIGGFSIIVFGDSGATLVLLAGFLGGITLFTGLSWLSFMDNVGKYSVIGLDFLYEKIKELNQHFFYHSDKELIADEIEEDILSNDILFDEEIQLKPEFPEIIATPLKQRVAPKIDFSALSEAKDAGMLPTDHSKLSVLALVRKTINQQKQNAEETLSFSSKISTENDEVQPVFQQNNNSVLSIVQQAIEQQKQAVAKQKTATVHTLSNKNSAAEQWQPEKKNAIQALNEPFETNFEDIVAKRELDNVVELTPLTTKIIEPQLPWEPSLTPEFDQETEDTLFLSSQSPIIEDKHFSQPLQTQQVEKKTVQLSQVHQLKTITDYQVTESILPNLDLLDERESHVEGFTTEELENMSRLVEKILNDYNVSVEVVAVHPGPVITRFELNLAAGVKVSRVSGLAKDLARSLAVDSVRIVEVISGKSVIGLEIPNKVREMVSLRDLLASNIYCDSKANLTLVLGKDIAGVPVIADLAKMPHTLVAGTTGSGKSVAINTMILSLLYKSTPEQVRMIMIDPKMLELSVYEGIPHLLTPVVTDMKEAANALRWAVAEMERRYKLMSKMGVRNLNGFNQLIDDATDKGETIRDPLFTLTQPLEEGESFPVLDKLPSIVVVIDELADMMMIVGKKVEELIARLAQKARAAGIHLILATQRPSVDVLTGLIKANVPTRISFQVSSKIDSRTILDQGGAEALLGNGDMLFLPSGTSIPTRAHGAFVDDHEVHQVVEFLKQTAPPNYLEEITRESTEIIEGLSAENNSGATETDALYDEAVMFVTESRKASISSVQRKFKVGYNRAARMIEDMEAAGVVSSPETNGSRVVLAPAALRDE